MKHDLSTQLQITPTMGTRRTRTKFKRFLAVMLGGFFAIATLTHAQETNKSETSESDEDPVFELGTLVVYGESSQPTDLLEVRTTAATLEMLEKKDVAEALNLTPGVTLTRFGGRNEAAVYVRGFARNQTPLFIDGVPVYVPYDGIIDLGRFMTYDVAAIDVAKGYSSALFGPNTMGGAINLVTRRPTTALDGQIAAGFFSGNGYEASANVSMRRDRVYVQLGASYLEQDHYELSDDFAPVATEDGGRRENSYRRDWKLSAKVGFTPNETDEYAIGFVHQEGEKGNPPQTTSPKYWQWPQWDKQTIYFISTTRLGASSYLKLRPYYDTYDNSLAIFDDATYTTQDSSKSGTSVYNEYTYGGSIEVGTRAIRSNLLKAIVHYKFDHHGEHPDINRTPDTKYVDEDESLSVGLEDTLRLGDKWDLQAGASYDTRDAHSAIDTVTGDPFELTDFSSFNPQAGLFYKLSPRQSLHLTVAHKSRFPTMKERYSYRMGKGVPNPDLEAETAMHYELGYVGRPTTAVHLQAALFYSRVSNTIQSVYLSPTSTVSQFQNIGTSEMAGLDLGLTCTVNTKLTVGAGLAWLHQKTLTTLAKNTEPIKATDTPTGSGYVHAQLRPFTWLSLVPSVEFSSWRYSYSDGLGTTRTVAGFALVDLKATLRVAKDTTISGGVRNLFDKDYVLQEGYPEAGRSWFANVRYSF